MQMRSFFINMIFGNTFLASKEALYSAVLIFYSGDTLALNPVFVYWHVINGVYWTERSFRTIRSKLYTRLITRTSHRQPDLLSWEREVNWGPRGRVGESRFQKRVCCPLLKSLFFSISYQMYEFPYHIFRSDQVTMLVEILS